MPDPFDLQRFLDAQQPVYATVLAELAEGRKVTHWIWFIFPQAAGLGRSPVSRKYAIASLDEARAYLAHPVLGARLQQCTALVRSHAGVPLEEIFGSLDAMKFRSSMDLFGQAGAAFAHTD
jgi:uncharacterized protein (DUF1810 family)